MSRKNRTRKSQKESIAVRESSAEPSTPRRKWLIGLILGVTFFAFGNTLFNGFAYDDRTQILSNDFIKDLRNARKALVTEAWFWRVQQDRDPNKEDKPSTPYYRPVVMIYLMMGWKLFGTWAAGWHFLNILIHVSVVYCVFLALERVTGDLKLATVASLLFAIHPMRSESVAWISGVTDLLLALFLLPSFLLYLRYRERGDRRWLASAAALFLIAVFTKEPAVCLPLFIAAYELLIVNPEKAVAERVKKALLSTAPFMIIAAFYFVMRRYSLGFLLNDLNFKSYSLADVLLTIPLVTCKYIGLLVFPYELTLYHVTLLVTSPLSLRFLLPLAALAILGVGLWNLRHSKMALFAILWFAINLLPALNLSAFTPEFMVQERYVYVASIGFSLLVAMALVRIPVEQWISVGSRRMAQFGLVAILVLLLTGKTLSQNAVWRDDMTLWEHGVEVRPEEPISHYTLGHKYIQQEKPEKAVEELEEYMRLNPKNLGVINNLAAAHLVVYQYQSAANPATADRAHLDRAVALCEKGLSITDQIPLMWDTLGAVYTYDTSLKNYDRAIACFERGLAQQPENGMLNFHLGATLAKKGNYEQGVHYLEIARQLQSDLPDVYKFLAYVYRDKGQLQLAVDNLNKYLQLKPDAFDQPKVRKDVEDLRAQLKSGAARG